MQDIANGEHSVITTTDIFYTKPPSIVRRVQLYGEHTALDRHTLQCGLKALLQPCAGRRRRRTALSIGLERLRAPIVTYVVT